MHIKVLQHPFRVRYNEFVGTPIDGPLGSFAGRHKHAQLWSRFARKFRCVVFSNNLRFISLPVEIRCFL
jgi:hypothetical protein